MANEPDLFHKTHSRIVKGLLENTSANDMLAARIGVCLVVLFMFIHQMFDVSHVEVLQSGECIRDYTFHWVAKQNEFLIKNKEVMRQLIVFSSFMIDFQHLMGLTIVCFVENSSWRPIFSFMLTFPARQFVQNLVLLRRLDTWLWFDPGSPSLTVGFHDTNDFYFSGHIASVILWGFEYHALGYKWMNYFTVVNLIMQWIFLQTSHVHYFIDLYTGFVVPHAACILAEKMSYPIDVWCCGWSHQQRRLVNYNPCKSCGWSN